MVKIDQSFELEDRHEMEQHSSEITYQKDYTFGAELYQATKYACGCITVLGSAGIACWFKKVFKANNYLSESLRKADEWWRQDRKNSRLLDKMEQIPD